LQFKRKNYCVDYYNFQHSVISCIVHLLGRVFVWAESRLLRSFVERRKRLIALLLVAFVCGIVFLSCFCPDSLCSSAVSAAGPPLLPHSRRTEESGEELPTDHAANEVLDSSIDPES